MIKTIIACVLFGVGFLFILAIVGGKKCANCNRHLDEDGKCIKCGEDVA